MSFRLFLALRRLIHLVVPHELYLTGLVGGFPRVAEGRIQGEGRFQGHFTSTGAGFPCQEDDDSFRSTPKEGPGAWLSIVHTRVNTHAMVSRS
jgi:hypothetical protein